MQMMKTGFILTRVSDDNDLTGSCVLFPTERGVQVDLMSVEGEERRRVEYTFVWEDLDTIGQAIDRAIDWYKMNQLGIYVKTGHESKLRETAAVVPGEMVTLLAFGITVGQKPPGENDAIAWLTDDKDGASRRMIFEWEGEALAVPWIKDLFNAGCLSVEVNPDNLWDDSDDGKEFVCDSLIITVPQENFLDVYLLLGEVYEPQSVSVSREDNIATISLWWD